MFFGKRPKTQLGNNILRCFHCTAHPQYVITLNEPHAIS